MSTPSMTEPENGFIPQHNSNHINHEQEPLQPLNVEENESNQDDPPNLRRPAETVLSTKQLPRTVSPPWKRVSASGPASFVENGRRRSGRTNAIPLELQPQTEKRQTRAAVHKVDGEKIKPTYKYSIYKPRNQEDQGRRINKLTSSLQNGQSISSHVPKHTIPSRQSSSKPGSSTYKQSSATPSKILHPQRNGMPKKESRRTPPDAVNSHRRTLSRNSAAARLPSPSMNGYSNSEASDVEDDDNSDSVPEFISPNSKLRKITFRVRLPTPSVQTPANIPLSKRYNSFQDFLYNNTLEPREGDERLSSNQIAKEAVLRNMVNRARLRGTAIDKKLDEALPDAQGEPSRQYAHYDHLIAHVKHFRRLLRNEHLAHRRQAKKIAEDAVKFLEAKQQKSKVKTAEELELEEIAKIKDRCRQVVRDLEKQWALVEAEVNRFRQLKWEQQQKVLNQEHLQRVIDQHAQMLSSRAAQDSSDVEMDEDGTQQESEDGSNEDSDSDDDSNMSTDESGTEPDELVDDDENLTREELEQKYANLPPASSPSLQDHSELVTDVQSEEEDHLPSRDADIQSQAEASTGLDAEDESDPSIDMDSDITSEDEDEDEDDSDDEMENSADSGDDGGDGRGLLGFYGKTRLAAETSLLADSQESDVTHATQAQADASPKPELNVGVSDGDTLMDVTATGQSNENQPPPHAQHQIDLDPRVSQDLSTQASPHTSATKASEVESFSSIEHRAESQNRFTPEAQKIKTPVPHLLRGTLREYQHEGLDWLANLYASNRNGILADEMGLGKTIQSIALLAHLAEEHEVWGPHLIIVPTSVMLNWEMEFKKFCPGFKILTYYGTQDERRQKRRGWLRDDLWNVCITSYQLVLQDQNVFKRRNWHYMILDEAHNIKNFRSQRWQTMLTFKTRARLLLTGTPLQNNLTELWSLLFFLKPTDTTENEEDAFAGLSDFSEWFKRPVNQILEHGREVMDEKSKEQVLKLHQVIRPYLLRRLKADVEKQMPGKYEHVELCRLSKRQRQLYDGFMSRAQTKETLASGNYLSIINCLMQLRKVCNHPDLFETRPITTSFAMPKGAAAELEIRDLLIRRRLQKDDDQKKSTLQFLQLVPISREDKSATEVLECSRLTAFLKLRSLCDEQYQRTESSSVFDGSTSSTLLSSLENVGRHRRLRELERTLYFDSQRHRAGPIFGSALLKRLDVSTSNHQLSQISLQVGMLRRWQAQAPLSKLNMAQSVQSRSTAMEPLIRRFACITPKVVASDLAVTTLSETGVELIRTSNDLSTTNPFHEIQTRLSIAFPDKRLLQYDCGKLQRLDRLLRDLQAGGHRALIFTQMTKVLDILEQFLNIHGHRYLRLDGATKVEERQSLTDRFNNDTRILAFILSSRSGGLGINLTGADTVIFYDLDWNPAMDKQCQDRAHRIGQTRDVHIYRFVSEHTIESNILRKANQKRMLDDVVIQQGDFTTDYINKLSVGDMFGDEIAESDAMASAAMDKVLGNQPGRAAAFDQVEDKEDVNAAHNAEQEAEHVDEGDFEDKAGSKDQSATPRTPGGIDADGETGADDEEPVGIDTYMLRFKKWLLDNVPIGPPASKGKKSKKKGGEHRVKRTR